MTRLIGIDLGGTKIAGAIWDTESEQVVARKTVPTLAHLGPDAVIARIADVCRELAGTIGLAPSDIPAHLPCIGVGIPGSVDLDAGLVLLNPNLAGDWYRKPAATMLKAQLGVPVYLINDARAFTLAEATYGAGRGANPCFGITLGTGIGGGIAVSGRLLMGLGGNAGELGHHTIDLHGTPDGTGNPGTMESFGSGPAIAAMGMKAVAQGINTQIRELVGSDLNKITPDVIARAAEMGDSVAQYILQTAGVALGTGIANVVMIVAPERVIIGGGVAHLGEWILRPIRETVFSRARTIPLERFQIVLAALGGDAGVIGAAVWADQQQRGQQ